MLIIRNLEKLKRKKYWDIANVIVSEIVQTEERMAIRYFGEITRLARLIGGLDKPDAGEIYFDGERIDGWSKDKWPIGYVARIPIQHASENIRKYCMKWLRNIGIKGEEAQGKIEIAAEHLDLTKHLDKQFRQIGTNAFIRSWLLKPLLNKPKALVLNGLYSFTADMKFDEKLYFMQLCRKLSMSCILITESCNEAMSFAQQVILLDYDGNPIQSDTPEKVYYKPNQIDFTIMHLIEMNIYKTELISKDGNMVFKIGDSYIVIPPGQVEKLNPYLGKEIEFGIRSENIYYSNENGTLEKDGGENIISGLLDMIEFVGPGWRCTLTIGKEKIVIKSDKAPLSKIGDLVKIKFNMEKAHYFYDRKRILMAE